MAPVLFLSVTIFFWGTAFEASRIGAEYTSPVVLTALRAVPAAIILLVAALALRSRFPSRDLWLWTSITGLLMITLTLEGISVGTARAGGANAAVLINAAPFFVLILSRIFLRERANSFAVGGLLLGFVGIVIMVSSQLGGVENMSDFVVGMGLALAGALGWAVGVLMTKVIFTRRSDFDMVGFTVAQLVVGGAAALALAFALEGTGGTDWGSADLWWAVAWLAIGSTAIATLTFFGALKRMSPTTVTAWQFLAPVVAVLVDIGRGNAPEAIVLAGMGLAITGVAIVNVAPTLSERLATKGKGFPWSYSTRAK